MGRKKLRYVPKPFESDKPYENSGDTSANIFKSMQISKAFTTLNPRQRYLYTVCKQEYYGKGKNDLAPFQDYFNANGIDEIKRRQYFTMNWAKVSKGGLYGIYSNRRTFIADMNALINHGFVDCIINGTLLKTKSLYMYSDRWRFYGTDKFTIPDDIKTVSMIGTRKQEKRR